MEPETQVVHSWFGGNETTAPGEYEGDYEDILEPRRQQGDFYWSFIRSRELPHAPRWRTHATLPPNNTDNKDPNNLAEFHPLQPPSTSSSPRPQDLLTHSDQQSYNSAPPIAECSFSQREVLEHVLTSPRVQNGIQILVDQTGASAQTVTQEAREMLLEMAHNLNLAYVRPLAFIAPKMFKAVYRHIYVNREGVNKLRAAMERYPVVLLPTHRSYADFILVSYFCFEYNLPLPVIAAAEDFLQMKYMSTMLRNCGAFFIRRSFVSEPLYWLLFTEYVRFHVRRCDNPLEFYIEGKRSRTGKSLIPKTGMLGTIFESWFISQVPDIQLVPITISYDRILEESLHAYELLGKSKPKESTTGLLKATSVLKEDFGTVYMHVGEVLSLRALVDQHVDRSKHALQCRLLSQLLPSELRVIRHLSRRIIGLQMSNVVIAPFHLVACALLLVTQLQSRPHISGPTETPLASTAISVRQLFRLADAVSGLLRNLGGRVMRWPGEDAATLYPAVWQECRDQHANLLHCSEPSDSQEERRWNLDHILVEASFAAHMREASLGLGARSLASQECMHGIVADYFLLAMYRNQAVHWLVKEALLVTTLDTSGDSSVSFLESQMKLWSELFYYEFCVTTDSTEEDVRLALGNLTSLGLVQRHGQLSPRYSVPPHQRLTTALQLLREVLKPYLFAYYLTALLLHRITTSQSQQFHAGSLSNREVQQVSFLVLRQHLSRHWVNLNCCRVGLQFLCLDTLANALGGLQRVRDSGTLALGEVVHWLGTHLSAESRYVEAVSAAVAEWLCTREPMQNLRSKL